jgi:hypothetical protein
MNPEQKLNLVADMIKRDAPMQGIDFADPANAYTVWAGGFSDRLQHCGSRKALDDAWLHAAEHVNLNELYIVKGPLDSFGIMKFERITPPCSLSRS